MCSLFYLLIYLYKIFESYFLIEVKESLNKTTKLLSKKNAFWCNVKPYQPEFLKTYLKPNLELQCCSYFKSQG